MNRLQRGVFWVTDIKNAEMIIISASCDTKGNFTESIPQEYLSKNGDEFNYRRVWETLHNNKNFDYYPRGRVQIRNNKAIIFCSLHICTDHIIDEIKQKFGLDQSNGIVSVKVIADGSEHYKCNLER